jgi:asparagine synthase (glutamine-hydrolysing)
VSLGAVRLKIIDLESGAQPMVSDDGQTVVVYNGEIYNHAELRRELIDRGHHFHTHCDTEVLLHAFLEWDTQAFPKLRGMFGAAFWNEPEKRLVLVRDRLGIKPLYFSRQGNDLYFGSELKAILLHPEFERRISSEGLWHYLSLNYVPGPHTLVDGIEKLPPGNWLEWKPGHASTHSYWKLDFQPDDRITLGAAKEQLDSLLRDAIREQLVADVPVGVWSSGGLDSSTIVHYAADQASGRLKTFSVSFHGRSFDETPYFQEVARHYQTDHHEFDLNPESGLAGAVEEMVYYSDEPSADSGALPVWFLSQMSRREVTVALSGEGADELFGGYNTYLADRYARRLRVLPMQLRKWASQGVRLLPVSNEKIGLDYKLKRMLQGSLMPPLEAHLFWNGTFSAAEKSNVFQLLGNTRSLELPRDGVGYLNRFLWLDQLYYLPDDILYKSDRMSMAHSLEVRPTFLDHRIVEFAARLPEKLKIRGNSLILLDTVNERAVKEAGILSWPAIESTIRDHMDRRANLGYHLWGLLILFLWMKRWRIEAPASARRELTAVIT